VGCPQLIEWQIYPNRIAQHAHASESQYEGGGASHERRILEGLFPPGGQSDHHDGHGCNEIHDQYHLGYTIIHRDAKPQYACFANESRSVA